MLVGGLHLTTAEKGVRFLTSTGGGLGTSPGSEQVKSVVKSCAYKLKYVTNHLDQW